MSAISQLNVKKLRAARHAAGLCVKCGKPNGTARRSGIPYKACPACRKSDREEARALKNILYPPIPPKITTAADIKLTPLAERLIADKDRSESLYHRFLRRGLKVEA